MVVCPVCEQAQELSGECQQCGKALVEPRVVEVQAAPLAELESTRYPASAAPVMVQSLMELEATAQAPSRDVPVGTAPDLERTAMPVGAVEVQPLAEVDRGRVFDLSPRTVAPVGAVTCRYCRNVQAQGAICDRCGMKLPRLTRARPAGERGVAEADQSRTRCRSCGALAVVSGRCTDCGNRVPSAEP